MKKYFIVGKFIERLENGAVWDFGGLFDDKKLAVKACITEDYFVAPAELNIELIKEQTDWPDLFYPMDVFG